MEELLVVLRQIREELANINCALTDNTNVKKEILEENKANTQAVGKIIELTLRPVFNH